MTEPYFDKSTNKGLKHLVNAIRFSLQGLRVAWQKETSFRQEVVIGVPFLITGYLMAPTLGWFLLLSCSVLLALAAELMNSGIEAAVDRVGTEHNELAGQAKDFGSAAVMLTLFIPGILWIYLLARVLS